MPFMDYRVTACGRCKWVLKLQSDLGEHWGVFRCERCGAFMRSESWFNTGRVGCMLIWAENEVIGSVE